MSTLRFDDKVALITGVSTKGLGLAYARSLAARGARVVVNDLGVDWEGNPSGAATDAVVELLRTEGGTANGITGDVAADAERIVGEAVDTFGGLDIVINNAGAGGDFDQQLNSHLRGSYRITQAAWPHLVASGAGRIVNISSAASYGAPTMQGYVASKGGILSLTRGQAIVGAPHGLCVNAVLPSASSRAVDEIAVPGFAEFSETFYPPEKVAAFVSYLAHADTTVTGEAFAAGGGLVARVLQSETRGAIAEGTEPGEWVGLIDRVMDDSEVSHHKTMWANFAAFTRKLSPEADDAYRALGIDPDVTTRAGVSTY